MKLASLLVAAVAALSAASVDANGVCYDPAHTSGMSASSVASDMALIKNKGFDAVRTYISHFGNTQMGPIITGAGLTAALGVPYPQSDYSSQASAAISAANSGGVAYIFVGNENLAGASSVPQAMIDLIYSVKSQVPGNVKVGTVQRNTEVINYSSISGWSDLVAACDVLGVNVHPFFTSGTSAENAMALVKTQWNTMYSNFGSKLLLTETGWPTDGSFGSNTGSLSGLKTFYSDYQAWMGSQPQSFFFQMYDTPYKSEAFEKTYGLLTYDSQDKFGMTAGTNSAPATTAPATTAPATTAPATTAPATTAPATSTPEPTTATPEPTTATPEPTTATPEPTTETPETTEAPEDAESSAASTKSDVELEADAFSQGSDSSSLRGSVGSAGSYGSSSSDVEKDVGSDSTEKDEVADEADAGEVTTESATAGTTGTAATASGTQATGGETSGSSEKANTQSGSSNSGGYVGLAIGGGACAAMVAFGAIYQTRKRAQELEGLDDKHDDDFPSAVTPVESINVL